MAVYLFFTGQRCLRFVFVLFTFLNLLNMILEGTLVKFQSQNKGFTRALLIYYIIFFMLYHFVDYISQYLLTEYAPSPNGSLFGDDAALLHGSADPITQGFVGVCPAPPLECNYTLR